MARPKTKERKVIIGIALVLMMISLIATIVINQITSKMSNNTTITMTPELARAKTYEQVQEGDEAVEGTENVKFDAFFLRDLDGDGYAESLRGTSKKIGKEDTLYMEINVQTAGHLKDAKITIDGKNFYLQTALPKDEQLASSYIGNNTKEIKFNDLTNGSNKLITGIVRSGDYTYPSTKANAIGSNINNYSRNDNKIILTGTYVDENGTEIPITKEVSFTMDWYGTVKINAYTPIQNVDLPDTINEQEGTMNLPFAFATEELDQKLILKRNYVEGVIPEVNGYSPISVNYTGNNTTFNYDNETRAFTIDKEAVVGEDGQILTSLARENRYTLEIIYPIEAYRELGEDDFQLQIPINTYYEGYNNQNTEFTNPYKSNIEKKTIIVTYHNQKREEGAKYTQSVGKYIYNPIDKTSRYIISKEKPAKIYSGESEKEKNETFIVKLGASIGKNTELDKFIVKQVTDDKFIKGNSEAEDAGDIITNVGIYFEGADIVLGEEGWIKVYDDQTGNLIETFTKENWNKYTESRPYKYELPVKYIRVETSKVIKLLDYLYVGNVKEIDNEKLIKKYAEEEFNEIAYIQCVTQARVGDQTTHEITHQANYELPVSLATISLSKGTISTQETEKNLEIVIQTQTSERQHQIKWQNGEFLVKFPKEIIDVNINTVSINNGIVKIESYEIIEQDDGIFIKISTNNIIPQDYKITINADITSDPRSITATKNVELYATHENGNYYYSRVEDIYDVNNNLNKGEKVNYTKANISIVAPNSLLTNQIACNYDGKGTTIVSPQIADIKPTYAVIDQGQQEEQTAKIGIQLKNNYASTVSEIQILGKIPFEGNTSAINGKELNSTFTTKMVNTGIEIPQELKDIAEVYYSENENPTKEISNETNNWKTADQVENWDNIKTFLIDLKNYTIRDGKEYIFYYTVVIPNGVDFNKVSYSHHGVYFCLDTEQGKYRTQIEPNKLGFRIAEKYDLEIQKYQTEKDKPVLGATYSVTEIILKEDGTEEKGETKTGITNNDGTLKINNLYANKTYEIKETKTPDDYEKNEDVIRFISTVDEHGVLTANKLEGTIREEITVTKNEGENYKATVKVEDEVKATLKIIGKEKDTENRLQYVRYKITGYNLPETGKTITTSANGEISIKGLTIGQEYTISEVKGADGYYPSQNTITFKIVNNGGVYEAQITGTVKENNITEEDSIPVLNITLENEKIPTYDLEITKVKRTTDVSVSNTPTTEGTEQQTTYLQGAKFKLYKDTKELGEYISDENGKIVINNLYQYVEGKDDNATYMLKEILAPVGYSKVKDITFKVQDQEGLKFINIDGNESKYVAEGNTVKLTIEDSPSFKLIKKDGETGSTIANVKFAIYNVDEGEQPARNSKGEILGTKETINGREYYTIATDNNGEITADLTEGLYKAVEVQTPEQYNYENQAYYFGIGSSREGIKTISTEIYDKITGKGVERVKSIAKTKDGGYVVGGVFTETLTLKNGEELTSRGSWDVIVIKYDENEEIQWYKQIGGTGEDSIEKVFVTSDGDIVVGTKRGNSVNTLEDGYTTSGNGVLLLRYTVDGELKWHKDIEASDPWGTLESIGETINKEIVIGVKWIYTLRLENGAVLDGKIGYDAALIKYSETGELMWYTQFEVTTGDGNVSSIVGTKDGGIVIAGYWHSDLPLDNGVQLTSNGYSDGLIIKYTRDGEIEWYKQIAGEKDDYLKSIIETSDGGYVVVGCFKSSSIDLGNGIVLNNYNTDVFADGMIIKYGVDGEVEWGKAIGGEYDDKINCVIETKDGGYVIGGKFTRQITLSDGSVLVNDIYEDAFILKYNKSGEEEWAKQITGNQEENVYSLVEMDNGEILVAAAFTGDIVLDHEGTIKSTDNVDSVIIKASEEAIPNLLVTEAKAIGGTQTEVIECIKETQDGGYVAVGQFDTRSIDLGNGVVLNNNGNIDGMIIKYDAYGEVEWGKAIGGYFSERMACLTETRDGGYIVGGEFQSSINLENTVELQSTGKYDGMIIKYDREGNIEWGKAIGGTENDGVKCITETRDGGFVIEGYFNSSSIDLGNGVVLNKQVENTFAGRMIIKYAENGEVEWAKVLVGEGNVEIRGIIEVKDGGIIVGGYFNSQSIDLGNGVVLNNNGKNDGMIIKYAENGEIEWGKVIGGENNDEIECITETQDGGFAIGGYLSSSSMDLGNGLVLNNIDRDDGMIIKYDKEGNAEWGKVVAGNNRDERIGCITETKEGKILVGGRFTSSKINLENGEVLNNTTGGDHGWQNTWDGMIIKYDKEGKVEWGKVIGGENSDEIECIRETKEAEILVGGYFYSASIDLGNGVVLNNNGSSDGMILKIREEMGVPEVQELIVENTRKEYKIKTAIKEVDGIQGGTISGKGNKIYEKVKYGENSTKEIKITPDDNYEIIKITINGKEHQFTANEEGTYTIPTFTGVTEDKNVEVTFALKDNKITINKVDSKTKAPLVGAKFRLDQIEERTNPENVIGEIVQNGQEYVTEEETKTYGFIKNGEKYESNNQGIDDTVANAYIPIDLTNNTGKYNIVINAEVSSESVDYGYASVTEDTTRPGHSSTTGRIILISGTQQAKDYTAVLQGGKMYYLHLGYYKSGTVSSGEDKFTVNSVQVTLNDSELYHIEIETNSEGQAITQIPFGKYEITEQEAPEGYNKIEESIIIEFRADENHEYTIENDKKAKVVTNHYKAIKNADGSYTYTEEKLAESEITTGNKGDKYTTTPHLDLGKYELIKDDQGNYIIPENATGKIELEDITVNYYYAEKEIPLTVHHYIEGTTQKVQLKDGMDVEDYKTSGKEGTAYTTVPLTSEQLNDKYELYQVPENATGTYKWDEVIVTYYYKVKEFRITTQVKEVDGIKGGSISGENSTTYENIKYGEDSTKEIKIVPDNGYKIIEITINGTKQEFTINVDGTYTMPVLNNVIEDKHIVATFQLIDNKLIVNKVDSKTKEPLEGVKFKIDKEIETGKIVENGQEYIERIDVTDILGELTNNGSYYFVEQNGQYIPTNGKTYRGSSGKGNSTANSYVKIDLSQKTGKYVVIVNAQVSSQSNYDYGYASITETTSAPEYNSSTGRFIYISGTQDAKDYQYTLEGGKVYYLHLGYRKNILIDTGRDQIEINSIKLYEDRKVTYSFTENNGKYESNNQGKDSTVANSYIPINLTNNEGEYKLVVNAAISSQSNGDYGYAIVTENTERPSYSSNGKFIYISGTQEARNYTTVLQGGKVYYLHVGYSKDGNTSSGDDKFTINQVRVETNGEGLYQIETNSIGQASIRIPFGKYTIIETKEAEGYFLNEEAVNFEFTEDGEHIITIENDKKAKVEVSHYIATKNEDGTYTYTEEKVPLKDGTEAQKEEKIGREGTEYKTEAITAERLDGKYELCVIPENATGAYTRETTTVTYYYKLKEYNYKVKYYYNGEEDETAIETGKATYGTKIEGYTDKIKDGYKFEKEENTPLIITENESNNIIKVYYVKRKDLSYTVNYLEKGTNKVLNTQKVVEDQEFEKVITSSDEAIEIDGYNYNSSDKEQITITTTEANNVINLYYTKRQDLSYTVNYLEKNTEKVISTQKVAENQTFESVIKAESQKIEIDGYNYDSCDKEQITISTTEANNVINLYYTKRTDLSYTVNYLEKETNKVLKVQKTTGDQVFESVIKAEDEVVAIDGYNYDSCNKEQITITATVANNVINLYYTKRTDLSYTINYLEKDTNKVLSEQKIATSQTFESVIKAVDEVIEIDGYSYNSCDKEQITITTTVANNVINLYYAKRADLSYTINYLEKDTNKVISTQKVVGNQVFEAVIKAEDEVITIDGYNYDSCDKEQIAITTTASDNIINLYYTKRQDLSYTINYLEKDTNKVLSAQKVATSQTFGSVITAESQKIEIDGYNYNSCDKEQIEITTTVANNVINLYYAKRADLSYTINYLEKDTNNVISTPKVVENQLFESVITAESQKIEIDGYNYNSCDKEKIEITTTASNNVINLYYTKRQDLSYIVNYLEKDTDKVLSTQKVEKEQVFESVITAEGEVITIDGYNYNSCDKDEITITTGNNVINLYYTKRTDLNYTVNYLEKETDKVLSAQKVAENQVFESIITAESQKIEIDGYNYDSCDKEQITITTTASNNIINLYYTKRQDLSYTVNYLEKESNKVLSTQKVVADQVFESVI
ncbi:MAG: hypothetical protein HFJ48_05650, partial [Clostridia bacterium]|nr:hypothetical protein [Clostridia bacterium]